MSVSWKKRAGRAQMGKDKKNKKGALFTCSLFEGLLRTDGRRHVTCS